MRTGLARTFARINKLIWDMQERTVDITITSLKKQDITLFARIISITVKAVMLYNYS